MKKALSIFLSTTCLAKTWVDGLRNYFSRMLILGAVFLPFYGNSQQIPISDFVLFSGAGGPKTSLVISPGYAVQLGSSSNVNGGIIGSLRLIKSTGTVSITGNVFSNGTIELTNSNSVTGRIAASNSLNIPGTVLSVGSNANLGGNIEVKGNIIVGSSNRSG